ncbi:acyl-CoA dehydrogenase family protein [Conexibacter sp. DBS9H8]|uniref:acyl-CoA dehydrogenase family protein n=1 Tax=Conexibacter sp. DBS9H8 TaxID=2937801 RepID=UPI00200EDD6E|nr:acyl-CoA dehydrogenase family protein [Conexibacter sp. DBS9H8]
MNFALSDEQEFLREAARDALGRVATLAAARDALEDPAAILDLWPVAVKAGWPGLLISEPAGGAGLGTFDALLVAERLGAVLARVPFIGLMPATALLDRAAHPCLEAVATGERRPVFVPARPPVSGAESWTVEDGHGRSAPAPRVIRSGAHPRLDGQAAYVIDAPDADLLVVAATDATGSPVAAVVDAMQVQPVAAYDASRSVGHVTFDNVPAELLDVDSAELTDAWYLVQALIAAEAVGTVEAALGVSVSYAKDRYAFGRAIGSYQAVKHEIVEVLRRLENARALQFYAGWARDSRPAEFPLAASAARSVAGNALDFAARAMINVHGGIGATWEHDAPLVFRRAQLTRRLAGGHADATYRVGQAVLHNPRLVTAA